MSHEHVTVLIPTFGRPELLEEAIQCFLDQTWPNRRLIIGNDYGAQQLVCDHPLVSIVNRTQRIRELGSKRNWMMSLAGDGLVAHWDDDDIYLPDHLTMAMTLMKSFRYRAAKQYHSWLDNGHSKYRLVPARFMHTTVIHTDLFKKVGNYADKNLREDNYTLERLLKAGFLAGPPPFLHEPTFINRYSVPRKHMTDFPDAECADQMEADARSTGVTGLVELTPHYDNDYAAKAAESWEAVCAVL